MCGGDLPGHGPVLLVDDEQYMLKVGRRLLHGLGYEVATARDGQEAVRWVAERRGPIRLVILDLVMPGLDGADTLAEVKRLAPEVPVLLTSGLWGAGEAPTALGADGFLPKPFTRRDLVVALERIGQQIAETAAGGRGPESTGGG